MRVATLRLRRRRTLAVLLLALAAIPAVHRYIQRHKPEIRDNNGAWARNVPPVRRASEARPAHPNYKHSVVAGGVHSVQELRDAAQRDSVAGRHYGELTNHLLWMTRAEKARPVYVSYRVGNDIYWTSHPVQLHYDEELITDGIREVRARCGNRISDRPQEPTSPWEPVREEFDTTWVVPAEEVARQTPKPVEAGGNPDSNPNPYPSMPLLAHEIFPMEDLERLASTIVKSEEASTGVRFLAFRSGGGLVIPVNNVGQAPTVLQPVAPPGSTVPPPPPGYSIPPSLIVTASNPTNLLPGTVVPRGEGTSLPPITPIVPPIPPTVTAVVPITPITPGIPPPPANGSLLPPGSGSGSGSGSPTTPPSSTPENPNGGSGSGSGVTSSSSFGPLPPITGSSSDAQVPEPGTAVLLLAGLAAIAWRARR